MTSEAVKVFPKVSELNKILNHLECPEEDCTEVFKNRPNLTLHLLKTHGKEKSLKSSTYGCKIAQYYCPEVGCKYCFNPDFDDTADAKKFNNRYFTQFKYLKQHYIKVHLDKTYLCDKCNKGFPTELHRLRHYETCGNKYICSCGAEYSFLASLQTHARREQHSYNVDSLKGPNNRSRKSSTIVTEQQINSINNNNINEYNMEIMCRNFQNKTINSLTSGSLLVLPKGTNILVLHNTVELEQNIIKDNLHNVSVSTQTDIIPKRRKTLSPVKGIAEKPLKKRTSTQTQTGEKRPKKTTETQTSFQLNLASEDKKKSTRNLQGGRKRKKSMETQTQNNAIIRDCNNCGVDKEISIGENYVYSPSELMVVNKSDDESNLLSSTIGQQDICLPQFWFNTEDENISKKHDKDDSVYLSNVSNSNDKTPELVSSLSFDSVKKPDDISLSFYNQPDFDKRSGKESSSCHIETQTDSAINRLIDDYLTNCEKGIPEDDLLDQYTRWTQTCDDIILPDDIALDFTNNETQTAWSLNDDSFMSELVNSETQTPILNIEDYILENQ